MNKIQDTAPLRRNLRSDSSVKMAETFSETAVDIAILHHSRDNPQMNADERRTVEARRAASRIVQVIQDCYMNWLIDTPSRLAISLM